MFKIIKCKPSSVTWKNITVWQTLKTLHKKNGDSRKALCKNLSLMTCDLVNLIIRLWGAGGWLLRPQKIFWANLFILHYVFIIYMPGLPCKMSCFAKILHIIKFKYFSDLSKRLSLIAFLLFFNAAKLKTRLKKKYFDGKII